MQCCPLHKQLWKSHILTLFAFFRHNLMITDTLTLWLNCNVLFTYTQYRKTTVKLFNFQFPWKRFWQNYFKYNLIIIETLLLWLKLQCSALPKVIIIMSYIKMSVKLFIFQSPWRSLWQNYAYTHLNTPVFLFSSTTKLYFESYLCITVYIKLLFSESQVIFLILWTPSTFVILYVTHICNAILLASIYIFTLWL